MPSTIISQDQNEHEVFNAIHSFLSHFGIGKLLKTCNAMKQKGVPIMDVFKYKLCNAFTDRSMYMQMQTGVFNEDFSKNTVYRFMNDPKVNWLRFTSMLSRKAAESLSLSRTRAGLTPLLLMIHCFRVLAIREQNWPQSF